MLARSRLRLLALVCAAALAVGCESAAASFAVDTSRLPRISGAREVFASPKSTSFMTRESVTRAFELTTTALIDDDWQAYEDPSAARTSDAGIRTMAFKKEGRALALSITTSPAQANATSVSYTELTLRNDLPFPKDATRIKFDPERPYLSFVTARDGTATLDYFRGELRALGWSLWSIRTGVRQAEGGLSGELTGNGAFAYYVRDGRQPLMLTLDRRDDGGFNVEMKAIAPEELMAFSKAAVETNAVASAQTDLIPVPQSSEDVDFDGTLGTLRFANRASVGIVAEYYRSTLQQSGWQEQPAAIDNQQTVALRFASGVKDLSIVITQTGARSKVTMEGSGLKVATAISRSL